MFRRLVAWVCASPEPVPEHENVYAMTVEQVIVASLPAVSADEMEGRLRCVEAANWLRDAINPDWDEDVARAVRTCHAALLRECTRLAPPMTKEEGKGRLSGVCTIRLLQSQYANAKDPELKAAMFAMLELTGRCCIPVAVEKV